MRRLAVAAAAAVLAATAAAAPAAAAASAGHGAMIARDHAARRCTPGLDWNYHRTDHPEYTQADIDSQCMPNWAIESRATCTTTGGGTYTRYSGIVTNEGTEARATCNLLINRDVLQYCAYRLRNGSAWGSWHTVCTPITRAGARGKLGG